MDPAAQTDAHLLRTSRSDPDAFCVVYDRYAPRLYRWFATQARDCAADLTAETFAQAWLARTRFRDEAAGSAGPWLFGIARNVLRASLRADRVEARARARLGLTRELVDEPGFAQVEERLSFPPLTLAALAALPEAQRTALGLRALAELGYPEIAAQMGTSEATARLRVSRARKKIIAKHTGDPS